MWCEDAMEVRARWTVSLNTHVQENTRTPSLLVAASPTVSKLVFNIIILRGVHVVSVASVAWS